MEQNENNNENQKEEQENKEKEQTNDDSEKEKNDEISKDFEILSSDSAQYDYNYKIIIIGDSGVGKTCLTYRATSGEFREKMAATIGFEYFPFVVKYKNKILKLEIWDTCGQEAYRSLIKSFFNNSSLAIIVYAVDNKKTFTSIDEWIRQCRSLCSPDTRFFLIGNKNDVEEEKKVITYEQGEKIKNDNRIDLFMETSAKSGFNVMKLFCDAAKILYEDSMKKKEVNKDIDPELYNQVRLSIQNSRQKKRHCC